METFESFLDRTAYQQPRLLIAPGYFTPDERVKHKVKPDNSFRAFFGDTTVFDLDDDAKNQISALQNALYEQIPECFCAKLSPATLHMTLHDLSASSKLEEIAPEVFANEIKLLTIIRSQLLSAQTIRMKSNCIFNCVDTSLVLALRPENAGEWHKLQKLYEAIEQVKACPYPLTPHITLAYYNYNGFSAAAAEKLSSVIYELNQQDFAVTLNTKKLYYQKFTDMNAYFKIFPLLAEC
ncbi:MAG: ligT like phosphoesterase [bacterium]|nr:ligT like phosphoesterase [bacterium]